MDEKTNRTVFINRTRLEPAILAALDQMAGGGVPDGRFWYDAVCGAWGYEGGPTIGFVQAGLPLPGPLFSDISGGGTGIFFNGRELHPQERAFLLATFGAAWPGRYIVNHLGIVSTEMGLPIANLAVAISGGAGASGAFSGSGAFGMIDGEGAVVNLPGGISHIT